MHTALNPLQNLVRRFVPLALLWLVLATLAACSGGGGGDSASVVLTQPPVASNGAFTTLEDTAINGTLSASDPAGKALTFRVVTNPGKGTVVINSTTGSFNYTPNLNINGSDSFTFVANNGGSDSNVATVTITITPVNDPPLAVNDTYTVSGPGQSLIISTPNCSDPDPNKRGVLCNDTDPDGSPPTRAVIELSPGHGALVLNTNGSFTYTHNGTSWNTCGAQRCDSFTYFANDNTVNSNTPATVTLYINQPPVANNACPVIRDFDSSASVALSATDPNGGTLTYTIASQPANGTVSPASNTTGLFVYNPNIPAPDTGRRGMDKFTFTVTDSGGLQSAPATVTILNNGKVRIMPLGDSITEGVTVGNANLPATGFRIGYRKKLYGDLTGSGYPVNFVGNRFEGLSAGIGDPDHQGTPGQRDDELANNVASYLAGSPADILLLHIGTNAFNTSATDVQNILVNINAWAAANYPVKVFVARIIQTSQLNGAPSNADITSFNNNVDAIANDGSITKVFKVNQQTGALLTYTIDAGSTCLNGGTCTGDLADDLHPNPSGYGKMADRWKSDLLAVLPNCP